MFQRLPWDIYSFCLTEWYAQLLECPTSLSRGQTTRYRVLQTDSYSRAAVTCLVSATFTIVVDRPTTRSQYGIPTNYCVGILTYRTNSNLVTSSQTKIHHCLPIPSPCSSDLWMAELRLSSHLDSPTLFSRLAAFSHAMAFFLPYFNLESLP